MPPLHLQYEPNQRSWRGALRSGWCQGAVGEDVAQQLVLPLMLLGVPTVTTTTTEEEQTVAGWVQQVLEQALCCKQPYSKRRRRELEEALPVMQRPPRTTGPLAQKVKA